MKQVWLYEGSDTFKIFTSPDEARDWLEVNDPEGIAYKVVLSDLRPPGSAEVYGVPRA